MIARIWHGYTTHGKADEYELLLKSEIFVNIQKRNIPGFIEIQLLRRELEAETEFVTIMWFDKIESVKLFAGENYTEAVVPDTAHKLLKRFDSHSQHYKVIDKRTMKDLI